MSKTTDEELRLSPSPAPPAVSTAAPLLAGLQTGSRSFRSLCRTPISSHPVLARLLPAHNQAVESSSSRRRLLEEHHANSRTHLHQPPTRIGPRTQPGAAPRSSPPANSPVYAPSAISANLGNDAGLESPLLRPAASCCLEAAGCVRMLTAPATFWGAPGHPGAGAATGSPISRMAAAAKSSPRGDFQKPR